MEGSRVLGIISMDGPKGFDYSILNPFMNK